MANRSHLRRPIEMEFNQYLGGRPYLARSVDLSSAGLRAEWLEEPDGAPDEFSVELRLPNETEGLWIWGHRVWRRDGQYALRFVSMRPREQARLEEFLTPSTARLTPLFADDLYDA